jgi:hypothetical protein
MVLTPKIVQCIDEGGKGIQTWLDCPIQEILEVPLVRGNS